MSGNLAYQNAIEQLSKVTERPPLRTIRAQSLTLGHRPLSGVACLAEQRVTDDLMPSFPKSKRTALTIAASGTLQLSPSFESSEENIPLVKRFVGIDWATKNKKRASVTLSVSEQGINVESLESTISDRQTVDFCESNKINVVAVDIPFGWPKTFCQFVNAWSPAGELATLLAFATAARIPLS